MTLVPMFGRDYKSKKEVRAAWDAGEDFRIADAFDQYDGKPINREDAIGAGLKTVSIRYKSLRQIAVIQVK
jgi:hypothetical protein